MRASCHLSAQSHFCSRFYHDSQHIHLAPGIVGLKAGVCCRWKHFDTVWATWSSELMLCSILTPDRTDALKTLYIYYLLRDRVYSSPGYLRILCVDQAVLNLRSICLQLRLRLFFYPFFSKTGFLCVIGVPHPFYLLFCLLRQPLISL